MRIVNLTPREIVMLHPSGAKVYPPSGIVVRVKSSKEKVGELDGFPIHRVEFDGIFHIKDGEVHEGLPEPQEDTLYVVSYLVKQVASRLYPERDDLIATDTVGDSVVKHGGNVVGCRAWQI